MPRRKTEEAKNNDAVPASLPAEVEQLAGKTQPGQRRSVNFTETIEPLSNSSESPEPVTYTPQPSEGDDDDDDDDDEYFQPPPEPSPFQRLLANLQGEPGVIIYVIRKPDPVLMRGQFAEPCHVKSTKGQIPFEESFVDTETIELAVQSVFGGGCYELQLRRSGKVLGSWSPCIDDPPASTRTRIEPEPTAPAPPSPAPMSLEMELEKLFENQQRIDKLRGLFGGGQQQAPETSIETRIYELAKDDHSLRTKIIEKYLGGDDGGSWLADAIKNPDATINLLQSAAVILQGLLFGGGVPAAPGGTGPVQPPNGAAAPAATQLPADVVLVFSTVCQNCAQDTGEEFLLVETSANELRALAGKMPVYKMLLQQIMLRSPFEIMAEIGRLMPAQAGVLKLDHAASWFTYLKEELKREPEGGANV